MTHTTATAIFKSALGVLVLAGGLAIAFSVTPGTALPVALFHDLVFLPLDGAPTLHGAETSRLAHGIGGGVTVGFGVALWMIATRLLATQPDLAKSIIRTSLLAWFAVDSTASILAGAPFNAVLNLALLLALIVPLHWMGGTAGKAAIVT